MWCSPHAAVGATWGVVPVWWDTDWLRPVWVLVMIAAAVVAWRRQSWHLWLIVGAYATYAAGILAVEGQARFIIPALPMVALAVGGTVALICQRLQQPATAA